ncbi:MAG: UbiA family prenyltransferase [Planctomycetaceae bacterium]|nr:UbiA family prenyltransferase [Planctomycetaceae bacterium]
MSKFSDYLRLMRISLLPTAWSNILMGFAISALPTATPYQWWGLLLLLLCSSCLYLAGMVMNDVCDFRLDCQERPERVLPSGKISLTQAKVLLSGLVIVAFVSASGAATLSQSELWTPVWVAFLILISVYLYNGWAKSTWLGPFAMGFCRTTNVLLGCSLTSSAQSFPFFDSVQIYIAACVGVYVAGITLYARDEHQSSSRTNLIGGASLMTIAVAGLAALPYTPQWLDAENSAGNTIAQLQRPMLFVGLLIMMIFPVFRNLLVGISTQAPRDVKKAVVTSLLTIIMIDASICYLVSSNTPIYALLVALLIIPAWITSRRIMAT